MSKKTLTVEDVLAMRGGRAKLGQPKRSSAPAYTKRAVEAFVTPGCVTVVAPLQTAAMSGHAGGHWRSAATPTKKLRQAVRDAVLAAGWTDDAWTSARVRYTFYLPDRRRRDEANLIHSMKPAIDGIVDAGVIVDDCWTVLTISRSRCEIDRTDPRVVISVVESQVDPKTFA